VRFVFAVLVLCAQQAGAESIRWVQPDHEPGDTFEYRVISVEVDEAWRPLESAWKLGGIHGAFMEPLVSMTVEARTTRGGVTGAVSAPKVYVSEPSLQLGLAIGCIALATSASRASRPRASQKWRSCQSLRFTASPPSAQPSTIRLCART